MSASHQGWHVMKYAIIFLDTMKSQMQKYGLWWALLSSSQRHSSTCPFSHCPRSMRTSSQTSQRSSTPYVRSEPKHHSLSWNFSYCCHNYSQAWSSLVLHLWTELGIQGGLPAFPCHIHQTEGGLPWQLAALGEQNFEKFKKFTPLTRFQGICVKRTSSKPQDCTKAGIHLRWDMLIPWVNVADCNNGWLHRVSKF